MSKQKMIVRTKFVDRICHWIVVISFFLVALSGIALFFPTLQWLTQTFGTPQMGRIMHPFFGILIVICLVPMFFRFVSHNIPKRRDLPWFLNIIEVLKGNEHNVAQVGKYNPGQKLMFWSIMGLTLVLLITGIIMWRPYFAHLFPIDIVRYAILIHAAAAIVLIHAILIHMYMAFWVRGSIKGMIEGKVSKKWALKHHPRWAREVLEKEAQEKDQKK